MQRVPGFVEKKNRICMRVLTLDEEGQEEAEEPLQPRAAILKFDLFGTLVVRYPNAEVLTVRLEFEAVGALLPPVSESRRQCRGGRVKARGV